MDPSNVHLLRQKSTKYHENIGENGPVSELRSDNGYTRTLTKHRKPLPKYLLSHQIQALLRAMAKHPRDAAIFRLAYMHGLRVSEIPMIQMKDYRPGRRAQEDYLFIERLKGSIGGNVHLNPAAAHAIRQWIKHRGWAPGAMFISKKKTPISPQQLNRLMKKYCEMVDIPSDRRHFHVLKHSCGTSLCSDLKLSLQQIKEHMGHANIASTMIYAQLTEQANEERFELLKNWK